MSVKIRLSRHGARKRAFYRIVATDTRMPRDGRFLEILGTYDPREQPSLIDIKTDRLKHWLGHGATPSKTVSELIATSGVLKETAETTEGATQ
jgi:small subunit ribosomal protein S16